ncbi:hypothetical protein OQA88_11492 [Cercophora sp. LCS_1]
MTQVWLITGSTTGFGLSLSAYLSSLGDIVIATGRRASTRLAHLTSPTFHPLDLDITSPPSEIQSVISHAVSLHGRIDVLVNNAGLSRLSSLEEGSPELMTKLFETNFFGAVKATQAVLPYMRNQKNGTVVFIGAGLGLVGMPFFGWYSVTKAALSMFAETLQKEIGPLGLRSVIFEPGGFDSELAGRAGMEMRKPGVEDYVPLWEGTFKRFGSGVAPRMPGDISKLPGVIVDVVKGEGLSKGRPWAVRVVLGPDALDAVRQKCGEQLVLLDRWEDVSLSVMTEGCRETTRWLLDGCSILEK